MWLTYTKLCQINFLQPMPLQLTMDGNSPQTRCNLCINWFEGEQVLQEVEDIKEGIQSDDMMEMRMIMLVASTLALMMKNGTVSVSRKMKMMIQSKQTVRVISIYCKLIQYNIENGRNYCFYLLFDMKNFNKMICPKSVS